ncbi:MAG: DUF6155 family protein [Clostridium sp.]|nr:DUF6155 family protein [Clostridium sp.]
MMKPKLKEYLNMLNKDELQEQIIELATIFPQVNDYYILKINGELEENLLELYKKKINNEIFPESKEQRVKYSVISEAIIEFQQISNVPENTVILMFYYIDQALSFIEVCKNVDEKFFISIEGVFDKALNLIFKHELEEKFQEKIKYILDKSKKEIFEFRNNMLNIYSCYY